MRMSSIRHVQQGLDRVATRLEELGDPAAAQFRWWSRSLREQFSESLIEEIWAAIQPMRAHMGYLDYADEVFNIAFDALLQSMEDLLSELRKASAKD